MKTFTVSLEFNQIQAESPLEAAKEIKHWLRDPFSDYVYDVIDEDTNEKYSVDLDESDEDIVIKHK